MMNIGGYTYMQIKKILVTFLFLLLAVVLIPSTVLATTYDLIAPSGTLTRGQNLQFTVNINTEGSSLSTAAVGMKYDTTVLQYVSATPGNTFTTITATDQGGGQLLVTGSSTTPYSGSGVFSYVTFKLIATSAGSTQLCTLYNPTTPTSTPAPAATSAPAPTALPKSGDSQSVAKGVVLASVFFAAAGGFMVFKKT